MKKAVSFILLALGAATPGLSYAETEVACAAIENARERLACFDQQFPRVEGQAPLPKISSQPIQAPASLGQVPADPEFSSVQSSRQNSYPAPTERRGGNLLDWGPNLDLETQLVAVRRGDQQRMVFRLANGQVWMQNSPRELPFRTGQDVRIKSGKLGGYIMRNTTGTSTRVRRIE
ncbi:MAG: hypothetical protein GKR90_11210 [Pseudomonadales bacterium]|nr:hypothetical protein [Pseudomonadales bacterium]